MSLIPLQLHSRVVLNRDEPPALRFARVRAYMRHMHRFQFHRDQKQDRLPKR